LSVKSLPPMLSAPNPHSSNPPLHAKQYSKLTNTSNNAEYHVPKNSPSIQRSCLSTRCPSKSKIRNILNLKCPKCPSPSYEGHNGHPLSNIPILQTISPVTSVVFGTRSKNQNAPIATIVTTQSPKWNQPNCQPTQLSRSECPGVTTYWQDQSSKECPP
jgi:hypothetical protein